MTYQIKGSETNQPPLSQGLLADNATAQQIESRGGILESGTQLLLGFIWLITGKWIHASFEEWSYKKATAEKVSKIIAKQRTSLTLSAKNVIQKRYEIALQTLTFIQLKDLDHLLTHYPKLGSWFISESVRKSPFDLKKILALVAVPKVKDSFDTIIQIVRNAHIESPELFLLTQGLITDSLSEQQSSRIQQILPSEMTTPNRIAESPIRVLSYDSNPLLETGLTVGISKEGYHYQIYVPFQIPQDKEILNRIPPIEVLAIHPKTQETHLLSLYLPLIAEATGAEIKEELQLLESYVVNPFDPSNEEDNLVLLNQSLSNREEVKLIRPEEIVTQFQSGHLYQINGQLSHFLTHNSILEGTVSADQIEKAQRSLKGEVLSEWEALELTFFIDQSATTLTLPCHLTCSTLNIGSKYYLDLHCSTKYGGKELIYTTRFPYQKREDGHLEEREELIERMGKEGSLARTLLLAESAFTRQVIG